MAARRAGPPARRPRLSALDAPGAAPPPLSAVARDVVRARLAELSPRDRAVVEALAVIGEGAPRQVVAAVAGVALDELGAARDGLVAAGLLGAGGTRFAHHLIARAIGDDLPRGRRERLHRETARALMDAGADADAVASHLLRCGAEGDPRRQRAAAPAPRSTPRTTGRPTPPRPTSSARSQERAPGDDRGRLLAELATVAFDAGLPDSRERLREALAEAHDRDGRLDVLTRLAALNVVDIDEPGLSALFEHELAAETDPRTRLAIEAAALDTLITVPARHEERARRVAAIDLGAIADPVLRRTILAHRAWAGTERGVPDAAAVAALAREALEGDELLRDAGRRAGLPPGDAGAGDGRPRRRGARRDRAPARPRGAARLAAPARRGGVVRRRPRAAPRPASPRPRTRRGSALCLVDDDVSVLTGGAAERARLRRWPSAAPSTRRASCCASAAWTARWTACRGRAR